MANNLPGEMQPDARLLLPPPGLWVSRSPAENLQRPFWGDIGSPGSQKRPAPPPWVPGTLWFLLTDKDHIHVIRHLCSQNAVKCGSAAAIIQATGLHRWNLQTPKAEQQGRQCKAGQGLGKVVRGHAVRCRSSGWAS